MGAEQEKDIETGLSPQEYAERAEEHHEYAQREADVAYSKKAKRYWKLIENVFWMLLFVLVFGSIAFDSVLTFSYPCNMRVYKPGDARCENTGCSHGYCDMNEMRYMTLQSGRLKVVGGNAQQSVDKLTCSPMSVVVRDGSVRQAEWDCSPTKVPQGCHMSHVQIACQIVDRSNPCLFVQDSCSATYHMDCSETRASMVGIE